MAQEAFAREFSNSSLRNAFADFLTETTPHHEAGPKSLSQSLPNVDALTTASEVRFGGTLRIDGRASGELHWRTGTLIVGEAAEVQANIFVATAIIEGELRGDIRATERVELGSHARVVGNIETPTISIQPGALFEGQCHFLPTESGPRREPDVEDQLRTMSAVAAL
jgi:cytoskeletal protein CcmA (bactofilin family)